MPKTSKCERIAPAIIPNPRSAPYIEVRGISNRIPATNSITPDAIRPKGSTPKALNIYTDSSLAENLKKRV